MTEIVDRAELMIEILDAAEQNIVVIRPTHPMVGAWIRTCPSDNSDLNKKFKWPRFWTPRVLTQC